MQPLPWCAAPCRLRLSALPPSSLSASSHPRLMLMGMVGGENIAPARPLAGSAMAHTRSHEC
eukprot:6172597-Pleurochrysis_carterae.AAC.1